MVRIADSNPTATSSITSHAMRKTRAIGAVSMVSFHTSELQLKELLCALSRIIRHRLRMDGHTKHLRALQFEPVFKRGDHLMHAAHGEFVGQSAVARKRNVLSHTAHGNVV